MILFNTLVYLSLAVVVISYGTYTVLKIRQLTGFVNYLRSQMDKRHQQRLALMSEGKDPHVIEYHDIKASFNKFDNLPAWSKNFKSCEVFDTWPCDY